MSKTVWALDTSHSSVDFSVRHLVIAKVKGTFTDFSASIAADPEDLTTADIEFTVQTASVDTRSEDRDNHLRSADFFDSENHSAMTFKATQIVRKSEGEYDVTGDFTIRDVTRKETFIVTYGGSAKDPWGNEKVIFDVKGTINRSEYGLVWNAALETGGVLVGEQVQITLDIQASKQA